MAGFPVDPDDPLAPARGQSLDGLLRLLERLDGAEEADGRAVGARRPACRASACSTSCSARSSGGWCACADE